MVWRYLTTAAEKKRTVTHGELAGLVGLIPRAVGRGVLDPIKAYCEGHDPPLPPVACIVVNAHTGLPGAGCGLRPQDVAAAWEAVFAFDWDSVPPPGPSDAGCPRKPQVQETAELRGDRCAGIDVPTAAELQKAVDAFDAMWGGVDEMLYGACETYADDSPRSLMTKWILVDRAYSAGLDRQVGAPEGGRSVDALFEFAVEHIRAVAETIAELAGFDEPLTEEKLRRVIVQHGRLCALMSADLTGGSAPRSFASKLLHFHCRIVPIMDSDCARNLGERMPRGLPRPFSQLPATDVEYYSFCVRFFCFYKACRRVRPSTTVKDLDAFLWTPPGFSGWDC